MLRKLRGFLNIARAIASKSKFAVIFHIRQRATHRVLRKSPGSLHGSLFGAISASPKDFHAMSSGFSRADTGKNG
jgi:hypothetical protein